MPSSTTSKQYVNRKECSRIKDSNTAALVIYMNPVDLIIKKRKGLKLENNEINSFIEGICAGSWADYQTAAMLMAMFIQGMDDEETTALTLAMAGSGHQLDLSSIPGIKVDKHSTGGVADTTTLILVPLVAACDIPVVKMSGRGLGFTGGTIDKLEAIPGFQVDIAEKQALDQARAIQMVIMAQTGNLTPADRILYALRDVTGTVDSIPLIAASIMSKKLAAGADAMVLDVKCGSGAFMQTEKDARQLASMMTEIGVRAGRQVKVVISSMDQPLGLYIGNSLEVIEAIEVLKGQIQGDLLEVTLTLGSHLLCMAGKTDSLTSARSLLQSKIDSGVALEKFGQLIEAQRGNRAVLENPDLFPQPAAKTVYKASRTGYISQFDTAGIGRAFIETGGGRKKKEDKIDLAAGLIMKKRLGDAVEKGDTIFELFAETQTRLDTAVTLLDDAITILDEKPDIGPAILDVIEA